MKTRSLAALLTGAAALTFSAAVAAGERPKTLRAAHDGEVIRAEQGSYCITEGDGPGKCVDYRYPLPTRRHLEVDGGDRVTLRFGDSKIRRVAVSLIRLTDGDTFEVVEKRFDADPVQGRPNRWHVRLPDALKGADVIDVFVRYEDRIGDSNWWIGIR